MNDPREVLRDIVWVVAFTIATLVKSGIVGIKARLLRA